MRSSRLVVLALTGVVTLLAPGVAHADAAAPRVAHGLIMGSGSSWMANGTNQWIADVNASGLQVVYTASGSAVGRSDFAEGTTDFAATDIPYQGQDPVTGESDTSLGRAFAYVPFVAGGLAFPYHVVVGGQLDRSLRLSGSTLAGIFTGQITNWDDPLITADNNGVAIPSLPIIPVVHSEGSGASYYFTRYLATEFPQLWQAFSGRTEASPYYPAFPGAIAQNGSDRRHEHHRLSGVQRCDRDRRVLVRLGRREQLPVAKVENAAGYFTLPTADNVAIGLTEATINSDSASPDYLTENLDGVYANPDARSYPLSDYGYLVIPTASNDPRMTTAKRQTLTDYLTYTACSGQLESSTLGYAPLPENLVAAAFGAVAQLGTADPNVSTSGLDLSQCDNPTFDRTDLTRNYLSEITPMTPACDRAGAGPCGSAQSAGSGGLTTVTPVRILDTRTGNGAPPARVGPGRSITVQVAGRGGVPATGASAVVLNLTATRTSGAGYLTAYPSGTARPLASTVNWRAGQTVASLATVPLGPTGRITVANSSAGTDVLADVLGWVGTDDAPADSSGRYAGLTPARILDTRTNNGGRTPGPGGTVTLQVGGRGGVPATGVSAVMINLTGTSGSASTFESVYPTGTSRPVTSNLNLAAGQTVANSVIVPLGSGGRINLTNYAGTQPLVVDVLGYFTDASVPSAAGGDLTVISPTRVVDSRTGLGGVVGPLGPGRTVALTPLSGGAVSLPSGSAPTAVLLRVTGTGATAATYLTAYPGDAALPTTSTVNLPVSSAVGNLVMVSLAPDGIVRLRNSVGSAQVVVDVVGYVRS